MRRLSILVPLLAAAAACDGDNGVSCPPVQAALGTSPTSSVVRPAVEVTVVDSASGNSLVPAARGAFAAGEVADSLRHAGATLAAYGPAGRYTVVVQVGGYLLWARDNVQVRAGDCAFETVQLTARMQRAPMRD
ncbi:MAG TPA: hypothetical protein VF142_22265 [Longimicrobium sp.]